MIAHVVATCLLLAVAVVSLVMAFKGLSASQFLPFHEKAAGLPWESLDARVQMVFLSTVRINGFAFLVVGVQLVLGVAAMYWWGSDLVQVASASTALVFCLGLGMANYRLERGTGERTPWRGSIAAAGAVGVALVLTFLARW